MRQNFHNKRLSPLHFNRMGVSKKLVLLAAIIQSGIVEKDRDYINSKDFAWHLELLSKDTKMRDAMMELWGVDSLNLEWFRKVALEVCDEL